MIPSDPVGIAAVALVSTLVVVRLYSGSFLLSLRFVRFWGAARRIFMPVLDVYGKRLVGVGAENRARRNEFVADVSEPPAVVARHLENQTDTTIEVSVLSGLKTDWAGNREVASVVTYRGSKLAPGAPGWLRADQIHVFMFDVEQGAKPRTRICAHYEANSWRPDRWRDHLFKGATFDVGRGVRQVRNWLAVEGLVYHGPGEDDTPTIATGE